ncbi:Gfo/Idh/MocA family protein [Bradyrhizobium sp. WSM3983]|uniref:Gfo/Idh/MocA family protein n=1 Tax=Bradyrhizobium sp. WSM3983 TaxID=1038867 RepID=UPI000489495C|nr:Gfo/Idh/MocA family oxidoreductase [Bradyrhizobium sp. WSM3983]
MKRIGVAVLGAYGWMGRSHCSVYADLTRIFPDLPVEVTLRWLVGNSEQGTRHVAQQFGAECRGVDWRAAIEDPQVDLVDICLPDALHYEVAKASLEAGKHVYCEKPFTNTLDEAEELVSLAAVKGVVTRVGHNFPVNPVHALAKDIMASGEIGEVTLFKAAQHVDSLADPLAPFIWRLDANRAPTGVVGDTGSHIFSFMDYLVGTVDEVIAHCPIIHSKRPHLAGARYGDPVQANATNATRAVTNPDVGMVICRFANGAVGTVDFSRIASGRRFLQRYEIYGTKGSITYDYDQIARLNVFSSSDARGRQGFRAIDVGPEWPDYARFLPLPNFGIGFNEVKSLEVGEVIRSVANGEPKWPTFADAKRIVALVDACLASHNSRRWEKVRN